MTWVAASQCIASSKYRTNQLAISVCNWVLFFSISLKASGEEETKKIGKLEFDMPTLLALLFDLDSFDDACYIVRFS